MSLTVNLRHLENRNVQLQGQLPIAQLDLDTRDEMIQGKTPLDYDLEAQRIEEGLLIQGRLALVLDCQCVRCLKAFRFELKLPNWTCHLLLAGEEPVEVVNDCVDLTPYVREDILLAFPQHPLCDPECRGLPQKSSGKPAPANKSGDKKADLSAWSELDKLNL